MKLVLSLLFVAFGAACLNYVRFGSAEHHVEWAREHGLPGPAAWIFVLGAAFVAVGSALLGYLLGRRGAAR